VEEEYEADYEEAAPRGRAPKSGQVTAIAIVNFVLGGLALLAGLCVSVVGLFFGSVGAAASNARMQAKGLNPQQMQQIEEFNREMAKAQSKVGGSLAWLATVIVILGVVYLFWGGAAIAGGVGVLKRRSWGRLLSMILAGVAGVLGLVGIVIGAMGGGVSNMIIPVLYIGYAVWVFIVMLKPDVAREFS
jgi:hypothetical protein